MGAPQEALSPVCWLCEAPQRLVVPQKMPGQRRIWRLPSKKLAADLERGLRVRHPHMLPQLSICKRRSISA